jgi:hypothetical protein
MMQVLPSSETLVLTRARRRNKPEDGIREVYILCSYFHHFIIFSSIFPAYNNKQYFNPIKSNSEIPQALFYNLSYAWNIQFPHTFFAPLWCEMVNSVVLTTVHDWLTENKSGVTIATNFFSLIFSESRWLQVLIRCGLQFGEIWSSYIHIHLDFMKYITSLRSINNQLYRS